MTARAIPVSFQDKNILILFFKKSDDTDIKISLFILS